jgi:Fe-S cluster biogenesis protein NfuA
MEQNHTHPSTQAVDVSVWPTPNPNALKFIVDQTLKSEGKATFKSKDEAKELPLALALMELPDVESLLIFQNTITVTKSTMGEWFELEEMVTKVMEEHVPHHDPHFKNQDGSVDEKKRREGLSPELLNIEEILDRTIRPGLQADGGDIVCVDFRDDCLLIKYQGACGTCPSSSSGTLEAIKNILSHELGKDVGVYIVPE